MCSSLSKRNLLNFESSNKYRLPSHTFGVLRGRPGVISDLQWIGEIKRHPLKKKSPLHTEWREGLKLVFSLLLGKHSIVIINLFQNNPPQLFIQETSSRSITLLDQHGQVKTYQGHSKKFFLQFKTVLAGNKNEISNISHTTQLLGKGNNL